MTEQISRRYVPAQFARDKARLFLVGEAPGEDETIEGRPFVGAAGHLLNNVLRALDIDREECHITNVFKIRPPQNQIEFFFEGVREAKKSGLSSENNRPPLYSGIGYLKEQYLTYLEELRNEIIKVSPPLIVAMGNTAMWALTEMTGAKNLRGHIVDCTLVKGPKVIMSYHPAAVLRQWEFKPLLFSDLQKALLYKEGVEVKREIIIEPSITDLENFYEEHIKPIKGTGIPLTFDIETGSDTILCVGFAVGGFALVVPFTSGKLNNPSYWETADKEKMALDWVKGVLEDPTIAKLGHNVLYDIQWLKAKFGICTAQPIHDTMVMFHSLQPEMRKGLNELVSMYTFAPPWKTWVSHGTKASINKQNA